MNRYGRPHPGRGKVIVLLQYPDGRTRAIAGIAESVVLDQSYDYSEPRDPFPSPFFSRTHRARLEIEFAPHVQMTWRGPGEWSWDDVPDAPEEIESQRALPAAPPKEIES